MLWTRTVVLAVIFCITIPLISYSCIRDSNSNPTSPFHDNNQSIGITDNARNSQTQSNVRHLWGIWNVAIDPTDLTVDIDVIRGGQWHANVVVFLQSPHDPKNLGIYIDGAASDIPNGLFVVDITLTHPLPGLPMYKGFDVRGAMLADATYHSQYDDTAILAHPINQNDGRILNADGYTRWFNYPEFDLGGLDLLEYTPTLYGNYQTPGATLNGYKYFSDDFMLPHNKDVLLQDIEVDIDMRGLFSDTSAITRQYVIQFPVVSGLPVAEFSYIVDASYDEPDDSDPAYPLESFSAGANTQECYKVSTSMDENSTGFFESSSAFGGDMMFNLQLFDWQATQNTTGVMGEIGKIMVESPTLFSDPIDITDQFNANAITGDNATASVALIEINDVTPTDTDDQYLLFTVTSADPVDYNNPWGNPYPTAPELAAYYLWEFPIRSYLIENTSPELGPIQGDDVVYEDDNASPYTHGILTDPDVWQTHTYLFSIVPDGDPPNYAISPNDVDDGLIVNWCDYNIGSYDMQCQVFDGEDYGEGPVLDIVRGLTTCTGSAHYYNDFTNTLNTYSFLPNGMDPNNPHGWPLGYNIFPRFDMDFFWKGPFKGQGVIQCGESVLMNFEADNSGVSEPTTQFEWRIPGNSYWNPDPAVPPKLIPSSERVALSIECAPDLDGSDGFDDNRIAIVTTHEHDSIFIIDADESTPTLAAQLMTTLTDVQGATEIPCLALDEDNDLWAIVLDSDIEYRLYHWTFVLDDDTGGPYYTFESGDTLVMTTELGVEIDVYDMVVAFANNHLYVLEKGDAPSYLGEIHEVDLNTSPPTYISSTGNIFNVAINPLLTYTYEDYGNNGFISGQYAFGCDIAIDHTNADVCDPEHCRLVVIGSLSSGYAQVTRLNLDLNVLDRDTSDAWGYNALCFGLSTATAETDRVLTVQTNMFFPYDFPHTFAAWGAPVDW